MSLQPTEYLITCDVAGCAARSKAGLEKLNQLGWRQRVAQDGQLALIELAAYSPPSMYLCSNCVAQGFEKTMNPGG